MNKQTHQEIEHGGAVAQKIYICQADDVAEYVLLIKTVSVLSVFFVYCGFVSPL